MKKGIIVVGLLMIGAASTAAANPLSDFIIGGAMMATGGGFYWAADKAKSDKVDLGNKAGDHAGKSIVAYGNANYYLGEANVEFFYSGNSATYRALLNLAQNQATIGLSEINQAVSYGNDSNDAQDKENLYKGVSYTTWGVGTFFMVKGLVGYLRSGSMTASAPKKYQWARNFDIYPTRDMSGVNLRWSYRI